MSSKILFLQEGGRITVSGDSEIAAIKKKIRDRYIEKRFYWKDALRFVGIDHFEGIMIINLPKYLKVDKLTYEYYDETKELDSTAKDYIQKMKVISRVLEKANEEMSRRSHRELKVQEFSPIMRKDRFQLVSEQSIAKYILEDYLEYGIYEARTKINLKNGNGKINWNETVKKCYPIIQGSSFIYFDTINSKSQTDHENKISNLHKLIVNHCSKLYSVLLGFPLIETFDCQEIESNEAIEYLNQHLYQVYSDREMNLITSMIAWLEQNKTNRWEPLRGTTEYNNIWEWVCQKIFGREDEEMPVPSWHFKCFETQVENYTYSKGDSKLIPDIVNDVDGIFMIFDAKYYCVMADKDKVWGAPAASDISKQVNYLKQLKTVHQNKRVTYGKYVNSFLIPYFEFNKNELLIMDRLFDCIGHVCMDHDTQQNENMTDEDKILVFLLNPDLLYNMYLNDNKLDSEELLQICNESN